MMVMRTAASWSPAVPGPVPRAHRPCHAELHIPWEATSPFVEEEAGPQEGEVPCPVPRRVQPQPWLTGWCWREGTGGSGVRPGPALDGWETEGLCDLSGFRLFSLPRLPHPGL